LGGVAASRLSITSSRFLRLFASSLGIFLVNILGNYPVEAVAENILIVEPVADAVSNNIRMMAQADS
jgi:hypothetical protein